MSKLLNTMEADCETSCHYTRNHKKGDYKMKEELKIALNNKIDETYDALLNLYFKANEDTSAILEHKANLIKNLNNDTDILGFRDIYFGILWGFKEELLDY